MTYATKGKVEVAYNRAQQFGRRRQLFDIWANVLFGKQCNAASCVEGVRTG